MVIALIFSLIFAKCIAPELPESLIIIKPDPVCIYNLNDPLLRAVACYESRFDTLAVNRVSKARGLIQITPIMIREVNKICNILKIPNHYTWKDAFNPFKSIEIWYIVQNHKNPAYDLEKACIIWFGAGVQYDGMTWRDYLKQIKKRML